MILGLVGIAGAVSGATLSITPSSTSNTYGGVLTLQIGGLTNGEQVVIERYLDLNTNGVVDAGEVLLDTFRITDGGVNTIGGVTNVNVPYDSNPAPGAITTTLSVAPPIEDFGQGLFRLASPFGNFTPQTNLFVITNAALGQTVNGNVLNGASPVPNAVVAVLSQPNHNFVTAAVADNSGHYAVKLNPGTYSLIPPLTNYYTDQGQGAQVTLTNGGSVATNLFLTNGLVANTISGQLTDATNGAPLGGVFLQVESGNLFALAFTDSNGNYSVRLNPSTWKVKLDGSRLARRAYVALQNNVQADLSTGSVANVNIALPKANALFYGRFTDNLSVPFANIDFYGQDDGNQFKSDGFSDANGNYAVGVFANGASQWNSAPDTGNNSILAGYIVSSGLGSTNILPGQALRQDFVAIRATAQITGHIQDNLGNAVTGLGIGANGTIGNVTYNSYAETDNSGNYGLPAASGTWFLYVNCCGDNGLESFGLFDPASHTVIIPPTNAVVNITLYPVGTPFLTQPARYSSTQFGFFLNGPVGSNYTVKASTDLSNWFNLFSLSSTSNPAFLMDNLATNNRRFYRVLRN